MGGVSFPKIPKIPLGTMSCNQAKYYYSNIRKDNQDTLQTKSYKRLVNYFKSDKRLNEQQFLKQLQQNILTSQKQIKEKKVELQGINKKYILSKQQLQICKQKMKKLNIKDQQINQLKKQQSSINLNILYIQSQLLYLKQVIQRRQADTKLKNQQLDKLKPKRDYKFEINMIIIGSILTFTGKYLYQIYETQQFLKKHRPSKPIQNFIQQCPIKDQLQKEIKQISQQCKIIAGCPGLGKSTAACQILSQLNSKGYNAYYISLSEGENKKLNQQKGQISKKKIQQLERLIYLLNKQCGQKRSGEQRMNKLVIDDINRLWKGPQTKQQTITLIDHILCLSSNIHCDVILISSNSEFINQTAYDSKLLSTRRKFTQVTILDELKKPGQLQIFNKQIIEKCFNAWKKTKKKQQQYLDKMKSLIKDLVQKQSKQTDQIINLLQYNPRNLIILLSSIKKKISSKQQLNADNIKQIIKKQQNKEIIQLKKMIYNKQLTTVQNIQVLKQILQAKESLQENSTNIIQKFQLKRRRDVNSMLDELDKNNLTIFCRPKSIIERTAIKMIIKQLQKQMKKIE